MNNYNNNINITPGVIKLALGGIGAIAVFIISMAFIRPWYNVWSQEMEGKAEFAKAEQKRKTKIEKGRAKQPKVLLRQYGLRMEASHQPISNIFGYANSRT